MDKNDTDWRLGTPTHSKGETEFQNYVMHFPCDCGSEEHGLFCSYDRHEGDVFVRQAFQALPFWERLKRGIRYIVTGQIDKFPNMEAMFPNPERLEHFRDWLSAVIEDMKVQRPIINERYFPKTKENAEVETFGNKPV